jgi:hypothetical protein
VRSIIYNYQGGAGGEGLAAKLHHLAHTIDKIGKVRLSDDNHNLPKKFVQEDRLFQGLMGLDPGIYLTHHLYILDDEQLMSINQRFDIVNIDSTQDQEEIFLLKLFKDYARPIEDEIIPMMLSGKITLFKNDNGCLLDHLDYGSNIPHKIMNILDEYSAHRGMFFEDNQNWHDQLSRIPGTKRQYSSKYKLGQVYLHGCYWNLDELLDRLKHA